MNVDVRHIAKLAKLRIPEDKMAMFQAQIESITSMAENLPAIEQDLNLIDEGNAMQLRPDVVEPSYPRDAVLAGAPEKQAGCFSVPKTVGGQE